MNFMIKDGILEGYDGPGGCITIPKAYTQSGSMLSLNAATSKK